MSIELITIGGIDAQQTGLFTTTLGRNQIRGRTSQRTNASSPRAVRSARYAGATHAPRPINVLHIIDPAANLDDVLDLLEGLWYGPYAPAAEDDALEVVFEENGVLKTCRMAPVGLAEDSRNGGGCRELGWYTGTWDLMSNEYMAADETPGTATLSASPDTLTAFVRGTIPTTAVTTLLTPSTPKDEADGMQKRTLVTLCNRSPRPMINWAVLAGFIPGAGYAGEGLELRSGGRRAPFWAQTNNPGELMWAAMDLPAGRWWTLQTTVTTGSTTLKIREPLVNLDPTPFWLLAEIGGDPECLRVTAVDEVARTFTVERGMRDSTALALTAGTRLWLVPHAGLIDVLFGMDPPPAADVDDAYKPVVDLDSSTNDGWVFAAYYEEETTANNTIRLPRAGALKPRALAQYDREIRGGDGDQYLRYIPGAVAQPATTFGLDYRSLGPIAGRPLADRWDFESPVGMSACTFDWSATTIAYDETGLAGEIKLSRLAVYGIDGDGNEHLVGRYDKDVTSGTGSVSTTFPAPVYCLSFRTEAWDPNTETPGLGTALEPPSGTAWRITNLTVTFLASESILMSAPDVNHDVYEFGRPDAPMKVATALGTAELVGIVVDVDDTLVLTTDDRGAHSGPTAAGGVYFHGHLVRGELPTLPADPPGGTADVVFTDVGQTGVDVLLTHRDAWA